VTQLVQESFHLLEVRGVEAFAEPVVDFGEHRVRCLAATASSKKARQTRRRALSKPPFDSLTRRSLSDHTQRR
jgi:hypothetical protein